MDGSSLPGSASPGITVNAPLSRTTAADGTGAANFPLTFDEVDTTRDVTFTETLQSGYTLHQIAGNNATCRNTDSNVPVASTNSGPAGFRVAGLSPSIPVTCVVYNREILRRS